MLLGKSSSEIDVYLIFCLLLRSAKTRQTAVTGKEPKKNESTPKNGKTKFKEDMAPLPIKENINTDIVSPLETILNVLKVSDSCGK